jgi:alanyl-tRNA synthetase
VTATNTEKLYLSDPYSVSFRARVVSCDKDEKGRLWAVLDRSGFYPESGGQSADRGTLGEFSVVDVQEGAGETVRHCVGESDSDPPQLAGQELDCLVDWDRRFDHMQQHTGQHVLSRAFIETAGLHTVSFHMGDETCTIDLDGERFDPDIADRAENLANSVVVGNRPIEIRTVAVKDLDEMGGLELRRSIPEGVTDARLVEVKNFDVIPCCGTHVAATGELGFVKVIKAEKVKGYHRVYFKVGARALRDYREKHDVVQGLSSRLTTSVADIASKVDKLMAEGQESRRNIKRLSQELADHEAKKLLQAASISQGVRIVTHFFANADDEYLRLISAVIKREPGAVSVLGVASGGIVCSASDDVSLDFVELAVEPVKASGGSGGGKGNYAQLKVAGSVDVNKFLEEISNNVKRSIG